MDFEEPQMPQERTKEATKEAKAFKFAERCLGRGPNDGAVFDQGELVRSIIAQEVMTIEEWADFVQNCQELGLVVRLPENKVEILLNDPQLRELMEESEDDEWPHALIELREKLPGMAQV